MVFTKILQLSSLFACITSVFAQDAGLLTHAGIEGAQANDDTYNSGGFIQVGGFNITVPRNMLVAFPAAYVPFKDFAADIDSMIGYEVEVIGNFVNGIPMAGQISTTQFFEGLNQGFIESLNFTEGSIQIRNGPKIRISDPNAVFSSGNAEHPFFTADDENPSISSYSGFPMCIPRNSTDPLCPSSNRPFAGSGSFAVPDPLSMAPFLPGDFIVWAGVRRGGDVIAYSIVANNVQILTLQSLVYIRMELGLLGIANQVSNNAELAESRFIGFVSNVRASIALYAMDIDPCTGEVTDRIIAAVPVRNNAQARFEYRADIQFGYARDYRAVAEINGVPVTRRTKNGLLAGTFVQPVNTWVHGEQDIPGTPPPAHDFSEMPWLTQGVGIDENGNLWGPLDPFPQTGLIIEAPNCGPLARIEYKGDEVDTDWAPSSSLLNSTLSLNSTSVNSTETAERKRANLNIR